jgi:phage/plasmid-associated DNA primase
MFVNLMFKNIMGSFFGSVNEDLFMKQSKNSGQAQAFYKILMQLRAGILSEVSSENQANNAGIKRLTGGDNFTFRGLFDTDETQMVCKTKLFLNTNYTLKFDTSDDPFMKRILIIPFINKFCCKKNDKDKYNMAVRMLENEKKEILKRRKERNEEMELNIKNRGVRVELTEKQKIIDEMEDMLLQRQIYDADSEKMDELTKDKKAFLRYAVKCANEFIQDKKQKLEIPAFIEEYKNRELLTEESITRFMKEMIVKSPGKEITANQVYKKYVEWCKDNMLTIKTETEFGKRIKKEIEYVKKSSIYYKDIEILKIEEDKIYKYQNEYKDIIENPFHQSPFGVPLRDSVQSVGHAKLVSERQHPVKEIEGRALRSAEMCLDCENEISLCCCDI